MTVEIPDHFVQAYANTMEQIARGTQEREKARRKRDTERVAALDRALLVLQGRLEGVNLAWHLASGEQKNSDDMLQLAFIKSQ